MATNCLDKILCENAWECYITVTDEDGNPIDPVLIHPGDRIILVLGDKPGHTFIGFVDENDVVVNYDSLGDNRYRILIPEGGCSKTILVKYCKKVYEISLTSPTPKCFEPRTAFASYGDIVTVSAQDSYGCHFVRWERDGITVSESRSFEHVVTENAEFVAIYDSIWYKITAIPNVRGRGTVTGGGTYTYGTSVTLHATPSSGYSFNGWSDFMLSNPRTITVTGNATYKADFNKVQNDVNVVEGVGGGAIGSGTYTTGSVVALKPAPERGYSFSYWLVDGDRVDEENLTFIANRNVTVEPVYTRSQYRLTLETLPENTGYFYQSNYNSMFEYGDVVTVTAVPFTGYRFVSWTDGVTNAQRTVTMESDVTLGATFVEVPQSCLVTVNLPDSTYDCNIYYGLTQIGTKNGSVVTATVNSGTTIYLEPSEKPGESFVSFTSGNRDVLSDSANERVNRYPYVVTEDLTLTANYETLTYALVVGIDPLDENTDSECEIEITVNELTNYTFTPTSSSSTALYNLPSMQNEITVSVPQTIANGAYEFSYWRTNVGSFTSRVTEIQGNGDVKCIAVYVSTSEDNANSPVIE